MGPPGLHARSTRRGRRRDAWCGDDARLAEHDEENSMNDEAMFAGIDWDLVLKALGFLVTAAVAVVQVRGLRLAARATLKADLEILNLLDANDPNRDLLKRTINTRIKDLYAPAAVESERSEGRRWLLGAFGLLWALGFSYWTFVLVRPGFTWWALLTGYLALAGFGWMLGAVNRRSDDAPASHEAPA